MKTPYYGILMSLGWLWLSGCAGPAVDPPAAVARLRTGLPLLNCREACVAEWRQAQPQAARLAAAARWADLAALLLRVGYQDDLSLYYLAEAAEGLGYPGAAASYYRQSTYVTGTTIACENLSGVCGGKRFPRAAKLRLAAIERDLVHRLRPRRRAPRPREHEAPAAADAAIAVPPATEPPLHPPVEIQTGAPGDAGAAAEAPVARRPTSDYIEPPPAPH